MILYREVPVSCEDFQLTGADRDVSEGAPLAPVTNVHHQIFLHQSLKLSAVYCHGAGVS